ncbi:MAG: hypothetical protein JWM31_842 [Solirubrobacterales bacterium]|nr:hypothetical protein [Solirubrobacterales bacterium]
MTRPLLPALTGGLTALLLALPAAAPAAAPTSTPTAVKLYFTAGEQFSPVERTIKILRTKQLPTIGALLRGPTPAERADHVATQIPAGVSIRKLTIDGSAAVLELSPEFLKGIPADPRTRTDAQVLDLNARLGQITYTLTQFPPIRTVKVLAAGQLLDVTPTQQTKTLGTSTPSTVTRQDFAKPKTAPKPDARPPGQATAGIRDVQQRLADLGYLPADAVDGLAGYRTQQAVMAFQAWNGLGRDGVAGPLTQQKLAGAERPTPDSKGPAHRIEVYRAKGVALLVDKGRVVRAVHVSAGGPGTETPAGSYSVFRKELRSWSVPFSTWLPYASYFTGGIAFHEYPDVPPVPASHGCVRVPAPEAPGVYAFASQGTAVIVR